MNYKHGSMYGTFLVPCEIIQAGVKGKVKIRFFDQVIQEWEERWVCESMLSKDEVSPFEWAKHELSTIFYDYGVGKIAQEQILNIVESLCKENISIK